MAAYGTVPTSSPESGGLGFISHARERGISALATRRPWTELVHGLSLPPSLGEAYIRIRTNVGYFTMNYATVVLLIVFLGLLWHPISLIVFMAMMAAWLFLYFLRDEPLVILHRTIGDRVVLIALAIVTVVALLLTRATVNILVSILIGVAVVVVHAAVRKTDDLVLDEEAGGGDWYSVVGEEGKPSTSS